jgi:hypothetical protein
MYKFIYLIVAFATITSCSSNQPTENKVAETPAATTPTAPPATAETPPPPASAKFPTGQLVSKDDSKSAIEFKDGQFIETYDKEVMGTYPYNYDPTCANCKKDFPEGTSAGTDHNGCFKYVAQDEDFSFIIYQMTDNLIEYSMIGGRGNTLTYMKKK